MKKSCLVILSLILLTCMSFVCKAQSLPNFLVAVTKPNVNVRQAPNASATVVMKAPLGTIFEMVSKQIGWYEVKEAWTGKKGYISASVSKLCPDSDPYYPNTTDDIVDITEFENISKRQNSETTATYGFHSKDKMKTNIIYASLSTTTADTSGRMRTYENYYKGKQMGWYIVLDEETDDEGTVQSKLDKPIVVFRESSGKAGIYIQGMYYKDANNPFE